MRTIALAYDFILSRIFSYFAYFASCRYPDSSYPAAALLRGGVSTGGGARISPLAVS